VKVIKKQSWRPKEGRKVKKERRRKREKKAATVSYQKWASGVPKAPPTPLHLQSPYSINGAKMLWELVSIPLRTELWLLSHSFLPPRPTTPHSSLLSWLFSAPSPTPALL
jgi:hypothetical protein